MLNSSLFLLKQTELLQIWPAAINSMREINRLHQIIHTHMHAHTHTHTRIHTHTHTHTHMHLLLHLHQTLCRNTLNMKLQTGSSHVVNPVVVLMCSVPSASPCVLGEDPHMDWGSLTWDWGSSHGLRILTWILTWDWGSSHGLRILTWDPHMGLRILTWTEDPHVGTEDPHMGLRILTWTEDPTPGYAPLGMRHGQVTWEGAMGRRHGQVTWQGAMGRRHGQAPRAICLCK